MRQNSSCWLALSQYSMPTDLYHAKCLQSQYEAHRALLKNGMILSVSVMIGVQPLAKQHAHLFDSPADEETVLQAPPVSNQQQQLVEKVSLHGVRLIKGEVL